MKVTSLAFVLLLILAHAMGDADQLVGQPLSLFRDDERAWLGYLLFAMLLAVGCCYVAALARCRRPGLAGAAGLAVLLLVVVAVTHSFGGLHLACSLLLLLLLFGYFAGLLYLAESFWLIAHLALPVGLAVATRFHSYGIWQKGLVVYFVVAAVIHHHLLVRQAPTAAGAARPQPSKKRRKVYRLESGPEWRRRASPADSRT